MNLGNHDLNSKLTGSIIWISAKDRVTGDILRCETRIGQIHNIKILTNMRSIDVDDINLLEVQAFDQEGNVFSTVEGLKFKWHIEENPEALRIIPIKEAHFKTSDKKSEMERRKLMTDISLLKGIKTGKARVSVQLIEEGYEAVAKDSVVLSVIEPFTLKPNYEVYLLPNCDFMFGILKMKIIDKQMNFKPVSLPTKDYIFFSGNETLGTIMNTGKFHSKNHIGDVYVEARDTAINSNRAENIVHIVEPSSLEIELYDITEQVKNHGLNNYASTLYNAENDSEIISLSKKKVEYSGSWILVEERFYLFNFILHDEKLHEIQLTENLLFDLNLNKEFLQVFDKSKITISKSQHSNLYIVKALKEVKGSPAVGKLDKVETTDKLVYKFKYDSLKLTRNIQITSQIEIIHPTSEIILPYLGYFKKPSFDIGQQIWQLPIKGGTGEYTWTTDDANVAFVRSDAGISKIGEVHGHHLGQTVITVYDRKNLFNYASIHVYVTKVYSFVWLESKIEKPMGGEIDYSSLIAYDDSGHKYTN